MATQLLVRMFDVGLGDCIYVRVPDQGSDRHILIDCGNKFSSGDLLKDAVASLEQELPRHPADPTKKRLDLLVVTHPHEDHHKGFEAASFARIKIDNLWLSPAFDRLNPQAKNLHALQERVGMAAQRLAAVAPAGPFKEMLEDILSLSKSAAIEMLNTTLPQMNGIRPRYVSAETLQDDLNFFTDPNIRLKVLAPMTDVDRFYLGGVGQPLHLGLGEEEGYAALFPDPKTLPPITQPTNISPQDFDQLRRGIQPNLLAAADALGHATNNLSVVLLLEWRGNRLLFPGDAEWSGSQIEVKASGNNGSWNVMWQERRAELAQPLDFLKVGHHGSENATPWAPPKQGGEAHPISVILDRLLPVPQPGQEPVAQAVVSTQRTARWPSIPDPAVIAELGRRVANATDRYEKDAKILAGTRQPRRTDQEDLQPLQKWIDVRFLPK